MIMEEQRAKIKEILEDYKNAPNKDLVSAMDLLNGDFEKTKELIIKLSKYLDFVEESYTKIHVEYMGRKQI